MPAGEDDRSVEQLALVFFQHERRGALKNLYPYGFTMNELFDDILAMEDVQGIILLSFQGDVVFQKLEGSGGFDPESVSWWPSFVEALQGIRESDAVFENNRIYIRQTDAGYLLVIMGLFAPVAKLRLNCDVLLPNLREKENKHKGKRWFFQKKR